MAMTSVLQSLRREVSPMALAELPARCPHSVDRDHPTPLQKPLSPLAATLVIGWEHHLAIVHKAPSGPHKLGAGFFRCPRSPNILR